MREVKTLRTDPFSPPRETIGIVIGGAILIGSLYAMSRLEGVKG